MKTFRLLFVSVVTSLFMTMSCYDDTVIQKQLADHEERISGLEDRCSQLNGNISSLQTIVSALEKKDFVTGVVPIKEDGKEVGYTITFTTSNPVNIYHGTDAVAPVVGIKQENGLYYWTIDGEWMKDESGKKIPTTGKDGENGQTPRLKIEDNYWCVTFDEGENANWTQLGMAIGQKGEQGDSFFNNVINGVDEVILEFADGTEIALPKLSPFSISFDTDAVEFSLGCTYSFDYVLTGADESCTIAVITSDGLTAKVVKNDIATGRIEVTVPKTYVERSTVAVLISDGYGRMYMKALNFIYEGSMDVSRPVFVVSSAEALNVPAEGGSISIPVQTNMNYIVEVAEVSQDWLSFTDVATKAALRDEDIMLVARANNGVRRNGFVYILDVADRSVVQTICIMQAASDDASDVIVFNDAAFGKYMVDHYDTNLDGYLSFDEASYVIGLDISSKTYTDLSGLEFCVNIETLNCSGCTQLTNLDLKSNTKLEYLNCDNCSALAGLDLSGNVMLKELRVSKCSALNSLDLSACKGLEYLNCASCRMSNVILEDARSLKTLICSNCSNLTSLNLSNCSSLTDLNVSSCCLSAIDLSDCYQLAALDCTGNKLTSLDVSRCTKLKSLDLGGSSNVYSVINLGSNPYITDLTHSTWATTGISVKNVKVISKYLKEIKLLFDGSANSSVDFSECPNLEYFRGNSFNGVLDLSNMHKLKNIYLYCPYLIQDINLEGTENVESIEIFRSGNVYPEVRSWDFSNLPRLKNIELQVTTRPNTLDLSGSPLLERIYLDVNNLVLGEKPNLQNIDVNVNNIAVEDLESLKNVDLYFNSLSSKDLLIDFSKCSSLENMSITNYNNDLDVSNSKALKSLYVSKLGGDLVLPETESLTELRVYNSNAISSLDLSNLPGLQQFNGSENLSLTSLNFTANLKIKNISYSNGVLESITVKGCKHLTTLACDDNKIVALDVDGCEALETLNCENNRLVGLDVRNCPKLKSLDCSGMDSLEKIIVKTGQYLSFVTESRHENYIPEHTVIEYVD